MTTKDLFLDLFINQLRSSLANNYKSTITKDPNEIYASIAAIIRINPSINILPNKQHKSPYQLLVIRRSVQPTDKHPGDTALPGGRSPRNESLRDTAERETMEEIGLDLRDDHLIYRLFT